MTHDTTSTEQSRKLEAQIKEIEARVMSDRLGSDNYDYLQMKALTDKFLEITKPVNKPHNFNTNQNLI